jgi:hypothetical protein
LTTKSEGSKSVIVSSNTRWLAIVTGCLTSVAGLAIGFGLGFAVLAAILIAGSALQPRFNRAGRGLICFGAIVLSGYVFDIGFFVVTEGHAGDFIHWTSLTLLASVLLVAACDWAIVAEEMRIRRAESVPKRPAQAEVAEGAQLRWRTTKT